jgi:hypothetical protein
MTIKTSYCKQLPAPTLRIVEEFFNFCGDPNVAGSFYRVGMGID